ncbi:hypothetical protein Halha_0589 [Halobacteroides halobius DSM 5150]|uniref:Uncharacterized protein n=1 Tax=Halobacteroides halobius (strain ATCC 35273 / DSM 5150 / MD-1) TaxID=748449 RepID=L0K8W4_HALHC|nr:hypothetical protein [Halobacteroides halobius]AGB40563.1 hypothetical protein Halha_0589 [Halobacteroides halobius DSM 5150]
MKVKNIILVVAIGLIVLSVWLVKNDVFFKEDEISSRAKKVFSPSKVELRCDKSD